MTKQGFLSKMRELNKQYFLKEVWPILQTNSCMYYCITVLLYYSNVCITRAISGALHELIKVVHALGPVHDVVHVEVEAARVDTRR